MNQETISPRLRGIPISLITILLLAVFIGLGQVAARVSGSDFLGPFMAYMGVSYSVWTYVFFFNGGYRFRERSKRLMLLVALSALGFTVATITFPFVNGGVYSVVMAVVLSVPAVIELVMGRPIFRRPPP